MDQNEEAANLGAADYAVFAVMLALSAAIGFYFAYKERRKKDGAQVYLVAEKQMNFIPVAISLSLTMISAVTVLGLPAEIHYYGSVYFWLLPASLLWVSPVVGEVFLPAFYRMRISSVFEYIEMRFNRFLRLLCTLIYIVQNIMYIGVMIYAPALALSSVTNFSLWVGIVSVGLVCTLYTTLGGLKAVIWTDVFQGLLLICVVIVVLFKSAEEAGGFDSVWEANHRGQRIDFFHFETDPRIRLTFWSVFIGLGFLWMFIFGVNQSQVQRYISCKTERDAKRGLYLGVFVAIVLMTMILIVGFITYAYFKDCDPYFSGKISAPDQIVPYMVLRIFRNQPGMPGLFVSGLFAGCLSTVSSGINAMACVTVKDFVQPFVKKSPTFMTWVSRGLVFMYGALCIGFAFLSSTLGGLVQGSLSILGLLGGPLIGIFSLGMTFPCANSKGGAAGLITGIALTSWIFIGSTIYPPGVEFLRPKPINISGCHHENTSTSTVATMTLPTTADGRITNAVASKPALADLYAVSYAYYTAIGYGATLIVGLSVSLLTRGYQNRKHVDPALIIPMLDHKLLRWLPSKFRRWMWCSVRHDKVNRSENIAMSEKCDVPVCNPGSYHRHSDELPTVARNTKNPYEPSWSYHHYDIFPNNPVLDPQSNAEVELTEVQF